MNLYELTGDQLRIKNELIAKGMDDDTVQDTMESISGEFEDKVVAYVAFAREELAEAAAINAEAQRMIARAEAIEKSAERKLSTVKNSMISIGRNKVDSVLFKISLDKTPPSLKIDDATLIPADYFKQPETPPPVLDKTLVKKAIKDGFTIPGCHLESGVRLSIK